MPGRNFAEGLLGVLFSPSRGLFIFSPIFFFSILGIFLKIKQHQLQPQDKYIIGIIFFHWIMVGIFPRWWAGWSFGARYFSDILPYLIYFLLPVLKYEKMFAGVKKMAYRTLFFLGYCQELCIRKYWAHPYVPFKLPFLTHHRRTRHPESHEPATGPCSVFSSAVLPGLRVWTPSLVSLCGTRSPWFGASCASR